VSLIDEIINSDHDNSDEKTIFDLKYLFEIDEKAIFIHK